jgi:hypothetical protein
LVWDPVTPLGIDSGFYTWFPPDGRQVWTFSTPVNLSFTLTNLNGGPPFPQEGVVLPAGTVCDVSGLDPAFGFTFNAATATLAHTGPDASLAATGALIPCTLNNATQLTLDGTGFSMTQVRGLHSLTVTPATITAAFSNLPPSLPPGQTATGVSLTCKNDGPGPDAINANCIPSITSGGGGISNLSCTPAALPVAVLHNGETIVCTFDLTAPNTPVVDIRLQGKATADGLDDAVVAGMTAGARILSPAGATAVPTMSELALALLALLTMGAAAVGLRRGG